MFQNRKRFNQVIRPKDNGGLMPVAEQTTEQKKMMTARPTHEEIMELKDAECPNCHGRLFADCYWLKKFPAVHPKNIKSQNVLIPAMLHYCLNCGQEIGPKEIERLFK